jgi:drug/metabolite transporter (DMT)-like permease
MNPIIKSYLQLHFAVLIWGFTAVLGLLIALPAVEMVFYRSLIATLGLLALLAFTKRQFNIGKAEIWKISGTGLLIGIHWILFFESARLSTASVCLAGMATSSLWTSLLEPIMTKGKKIKAFELILALLAIIGIVVIFNVSFKYALGLAVAIVSALFASIFTIINAKLTVKHDHYTITFYEMLSASVSILVFMLFYKGLGNIAFPKGMDWPWLLILGLVCTVYAYSMAVKIMRTLSPFVVNLTINLEPVYGIALAVLIIGGKEEMSFGFYIGTAIILSSVLLYPILNRYHKRKALAADLLR